MSLNFTVQDAEEFTLFPISPEGRFKAQIIDIDYIRGEYGNYNFIDYKILDHPIHEGTVHREKYKVEHEIEGVRNIAKSNFNKVCIEIGGLKKGDEPEKKHFLYKIGMITIRHRLGKDGKNYANVTDVQKLEGGGQESNPGVTYGSIAITPATSVAPSFPIPLNDDVPF